MATLTVIGILLFALIAAVGALWLLIVIFNESILWGLASLFLPGASFLFAITHWEDSKRPFGLHFAGLAGCFVMMFAMGFTKPGERTGEDSAPTKKSAAVDPCPTAADVSDGFSRWCCSPLGRWNKVGQGADCTSTPAPSDICDATKVGTISTEGCSTLGGSKRRR